MPIDVNAIAVASDGSITITDDALRSMLSVAVAGPTRVKANDSKCVNNGCSGSNGYGCVNNVCS